PRAPRRPHGARPRPRLLRRRTATRGRASPPRHGETDACRPPRDGGHPPPAAACARRTPPAGRGASRPAGRRGRARPRAGGGRVAQEVAVLADRSDVTEELVRLEGHLVALAATLRERGPVGKRIEFLLQEIHRELNTTGSKAGDRGITDLVLASKSEVERLREQGQNGE